MAIKAQKVVRQTNPGKGHKEGHASEKRSCAAPKLHRGLGNCTSALRDTENR